MLIKIPGFNLQYLLQKAMGQNLSQKELIFLLSLDKPVEIEKVLACARQVRQKYFGNKIFLYGFLYFSTYCRNQCTFCYYRQGNASSPRYRKTVAEAVEIAQMLASSGVHLIDLTMGEDPLLFRGDNFGILTGLVREVKRATGLPVMASPGVVPAKVLLKLKEEGADWYACYQETHNRGLYQGLRKNQNYDKRMINKTIAKSLGLLIEEGILVGVGENVRDIADSIIEMRKMEAHQVRVMSFVPQCNTPMVNVPSPPRQKEILTIAVMRLALQDRLIPASLDIDGIHGLRRRLDAGANVITSIIPPRLGLAGVSQSKLDINEGNRTAKEAVKCLRSIGLEPAAVGEYQAWVAREKDFVGKSKIQDTVDWERRL